jgi:hypothetical protein
MFDLPTGYRFIKTGLFVTGTDTPIAEIMLPDNVITRPGDL